MLATKNWFYLWKMDWIKSKDYVMVAASLTGYPAAFYLYLYICIMTIYAKNIKYHMEYYVTGPFFLVTAAIFTVILLQNKRRSLHFSISSPLLSSNWSNNPNSNFLNKINNLLLVIVLSTLMITFYLASFQFNHCHWNVEKKIINTYQRTIIEPIELSIEFEFE